MKMRTYYGCGDRLTTWFAFCRTTGTDEGIHNIFGSVEANSFNDAWSKIRVPAGMIDDDHEVIVRQLTASEWEDRKNEDYN